MAPHALDLAPFAARLLAGIAAGGLTWLLAADYGGMLIARFITIAHPAGRFGVAAAAGYAAIGSIVGVLGLIGEINPFTMVGLLACAVLIRAPVYVHSLRSARKWWATGRAAAVRLDAVGKAAIVVVSLAVITALVNAALPAVWWDPIAYHLPIVAAALRQGSFAFDPHIVQTGFPQLAEAAAIPAYAVAGTAGAAMVTLGAGLCVVLVAWALADSVCEHSGAAAAMLVASSALWAWLAPSFYVDIPFALFTLAALLAALQVGTTLRDPHKTIDVAEAATLTGMLCGAAAGVKYSGLSVIAVVAIVILVVAKRERTRVMVAFAVGCALIGGAWYLRSWLLTGDPVYPFAASWFIHTQAVRDFGVRYVDMTRHWCGGGSTIMDLVTLPYRLFADPRSFCGDPGIALRVALVFALAAIALIPRARVLAVVGVVLTLFWFITSQQWRFLLPALFIYAAIAAAGLSGLGPRLRTWGGMIIAALGCLTILSNWSPAWQSQASASIVPALPYISGRADALTYLDMRLETFAAARWLREFGIDGNQIVALDDVRDYYMPAGTMWANPFYQQAIALDWSVPTKVRYSGLTSAGKLYLVVNMNDAYLRRTPTGVDWGAFQQDRRHGLREMFNRNGVAVFDMSALR
ncbi:MAG: hypothetical protein JO195_08380 [Candidatus Eremiobacteraeota bacterium]|nr:hypothetical protein [Candidatus Eremiobacteraeota bacterium]